MRNLVNRGVLVLCSVVIAALSADPSQAQTVIAVPFNSATLAWTVPPTDATHSAPTAHDITCGAVVVTVPMPGTSILVSAVVPGPGTYTCTVAARNSFGTSAAANFPGFEAGYPPLSPVNPVILVP